MATSSFAGSSIQWKYDVFLSFRGEDTRKNFTDHLYHALDQKGIVTFRDDERLVRGMEISSELLGAIEASRFSIIIISKNYASSTWCLDELAKIVECMKKNQHGAFPVFYDVNPSDVRKQRNEFKEAFDKHKKQSKKNVEKWRSAMTKVADLSGWHLQNRHESQLIQEIVKEISKRLDQLFSSVAKGLVGINHRVKELMNNYLEVGLDDVRFIGIYGMGGIGKTTIARALYETLSNQYDGRCFLANVREDHTREGLVSLQKKLLFDVLKESNLNGNDVHNLIRRRLCQKKVFLVLDDVNERQQLKALCEAHYWFGSGSKIIITTRDEHLLISHGVKRSHIYKVERLDDDEALELFYSNAFKNNKATDDYMKHSKQIIDYAKGLPLALEVLGSSLCDRSVEEWESTLEGLQKYPNEKILKPLRISYDGLEKIEKKIFLDIACFFKGKEEQKVKKILEGCEFPVIKLTVLREKSLITISNNKVWMHDMLQEMGWKIVSELHPEEPGKWSRLWQCDHIHRVLKENEGTPKIEGIILNEPIEERVPKLGSKSFSKMSNLRLLKISHFHLSEDLEYLSNKLRFLKWHGYPRRSLPSNFQPKELYELNMRYSYIEQLWEGAQNMNRLKIIKLSHSKHLISTPDFSEAPNIERLLLDGCTSLSFVHPSLGLLKELISLNLKDCKVLRSLPPETKWESLEVLTLTGCSKLSNLPETLGNSLHLLRLLLDGTSIEELPSPIQHLTSLITLNLKDCKNLVSLPNSICGLRSLKVLNLNGCSKLNEVPENLGHATSLKDLDLGGTAVCKLPSSFVLLKNLEKLSFQGWKGPQKKSRSSLFSFLSFRRANLRSMGLSLPSFSGLCSLTRLDLGDSNIQEAAIAIDLGCLSSLTYLNLSRGNFESLPESISKLSQLETLNIEHCERLRALPELPATIDGLFAHNCISLETIASPSNAFRSRPRVFYLSNCFKLTENQGNNNTTSTFFKSLIQLLLQSQLQALNGGVTYSEFDIVVPGSQVPEWFIYHRLGSSVTALLEPATSNSFQGVALCVAFSFHQYGSVSHNGIIDLNCSLKIGNGYNPITVSISFHTNSLAESDHLWLFYISRSYFKIFRSILFEASFTFKYIGSCIGLEVKECGLRPVYNQEVREIIPATTRCSSSSSEVFVYNRLAVTDNIKRGRSYYWPHQLPHPRRRW